MTRGKSNLMQLIKKKKAKQKNSGETAGCLPCQGICGAPTEGIQQCGFNHITALKVCPISKHINVQTS